MFYFNINTFSKYRLNGIMSEPAHYAAIMLPAVFLCFVEKKYLKFIIILVTIFLTQSSVGFIGLFLILIIPILKVKYFLKYSIVVFLIAIASFFYLKSKWNEPIDENRSNKVVRRLKETHETFSSFITGKFNNNVNLSSYAFISNAFVTKSVLIDKPLGTGLGAYKHEYDKYYKYLKPPSYLTTSLRKINRTDANSLFLRILSDFGLFAIVIFFIFIYKSILIFRNDSKKIQQSTFFYLVVKLIREGHYFPPEFYFFLLIFFNNTDDENITHS
ncbi:O-antigen ligase family protein [Polaribacter sp. WD7]|uniref:O-antigen ligase family protein n=1 Tax=Polaribacter sp. WD7 TaxID=2269061 RepID=UPI0015F06E46|nr:O-antigen ligase family protein [Polaribacter sp. WD7]